MAEQTQGAGISATGRPPTQAAGHPQADERRDEYLDSLKTQIRNGIYRPDVKDLARSLASMIVREL